MELSRHFDSISRRGWGALDWKVQKENTNDQRRLSNVQQQLEIGGMEPSAVAVAGEGLRNLINIFDMIVNILLIQRERWNYFCVKTLLRLIERI